MTNYSFDKAVEPEALRALLKDTDWGGDRTAEGLRRMLDASPVTLGAWEGERLVGFARAMTDGVYRALIDDIVVDPSQRGRGVGNGLMKHLLEKLRDVEQVFLLCGAEVAPFYVQCGFKTGKPLVMVLDRT